MLDPVAVIDTIETPESPAPQRSVQPFWRQPRLGPHDCDINPASIMRARLNEAELQRLHATRTQRRRIAPSTGEIENMDTPMDIPTDTPTDTPIDLGSAPTTRAGHRIGHRPNQPTPMPSTLYDTAIMFLATEFGQWETARDTWTDLGDEVRAGMASIEVQRYEWAMMVLRERYLPDGLLIHWSSTPASQSDILRYIEDWFRATPADAQRLKAWREAHPDVPMEAVSDISLIEALRYEEALARPASVSATTDEDDTDDTAARIAAVMPPRLQALVDATMTAKAAPTSDE